MIPFKNGIIYSDIHNAVFVNDTETLEEVDGASIYLIDNDIVQIYDLEKGYYYYRNGNVLKSSYSVKGINKDSVILAQSSARRISRGIYEKDIVTLSENLTEKKESLLVNTRFNLMEFTDKVFIVGDNINFQTYSLPTAQPLWHYNLAELGTYQHPSNGTRSVAVEQFIGVFNNTLWVHLTPGWLLGLDLRTGEQRHLFKGVPRENVYGPIDEYLGETDLLRFLDTQYVLDQGTGTIQGLIYDKYYQIDVKGHVPKACIYGMQSKFKEKGISPGSVDRKFALHQGNIYFAAYEQGRFGILNTTAKTIDYVSEQFTEQWLKDIQVNEQNVYVLDGNGTLFIFEKEENKET